MRTLALGIIACVGMMMTGCTSTAGCGSDTGQPIVSPDKAGTADTTKTEPQLPPFKPYWKQN